MNFKKLSCLLGIFLYFPVASWALDSFDCLGNTPFWKLSITDKQFIFTEKNAPAVTMPAVEPKPAEDMKMDHIRIFRTKSDSKDIIIIIQNQSCTDGKSEEMFPYEGLFITSDKVYHGCCSKKLILTK